MEPVAKERKTLTQKPWPSSVSKLIMERAILEKVLKERGFRTWIEATTAAEDRTNLEMKRMQPYSPSRRNVTLMICMKDRGPNGPFAGQDHGTIS